MVHHSCDGLADYASTDCGASPSTEFSSGRFRLPLPVGRAANGSRHSRRPRRRLSRSTAVCAFHSSRTGLFLFFCAVRVYQVFTAFPFPGDTTRFHRISWPHSVWRVLWAWATLDKYGTWSIWNSLLTGQAKASAKDTLQLFRFFWTSLGSIGALALHISLKPSEIIICLYGNRIFCFSSPFDVTGFHKIVLLWIRFEWVK